MRVRILLCLTAELRTTLGRYTFYDIEPLFGGRNIIISGGGVVAGMRGMPKGEHNGKDFLHIRGLCRRRRE